MRADGIAGRLIREGVAPLVAAAVRSQNFVEVGGAESIFFDLASVTKPMTAIAVARAGIDPRTPLGVLVEEAQGTASGRVPLELFLAHRAGLDAHRALYAPLLAGKTVDVAAALVEAAEARREDAPGPPPAEGFAPVYSDLGYVLAGEALARGSGHAGIFGTVDAVLAFGAAVLERIDDPDLAWIVRERPGGTLRAGFDGKSAEGSSAGERMGRRSIGHLGFTGTSLWIDPDARVVVALLTNRVCPTRDNVAIRAARPWAHDALFERASTAE
jgi:CubicO group peptidase (beta-lactamase class C family)